MGPLSLCNHVSQYFIINILLYIYMNPIFSVSLANSNTDFDTGVVLEGQDFKNEFAELFLRFLELAL